MRHFAFWIFFIDANPLEMNIARDYWSSSSCVILALSNSSKHQHWSVIHVWHGFSHSYDMHKTTVTRCWIFHKPLNRLVKSLISPSKSVVPGLPVETHSKGPQFRLKGSSDEPRKTLRWASKGAQTPLVKNHHQQSGLSRARPDPAWCGIDYWALASMEWNASVKNASHVFGFNISVSKLHTIFLIQPMSGNFVNRRLNFELSYVS